MTPLLKHRGLLLLVVFLLSACTIKGYKASELPSDQLATVQIKAPSITLIPVFWIFPLNMLAWLDKDWYETTWMDSIEVNDIKLNRFKTLQVKPGVIDVYAEQEHFVDKVQIGQSRYSYGSCCCTEKQGNDKKKEKYVIKLLLSKVTIG